MIKNISSRIKNLPLVIKVVSGIVIALFCVLITVYKVPQRLFSKITETAQSISNHTSAPAGETLYVIPCGEHKVRVTTADDTGYGIKWYPEFNSYATTLSEDGSSNKLYLISVEEATGDWMYWYRPISEQYSSETLFKPGWMKNIDGKWMIFDISEDLIEIPTEYNVDAGYLWYIE